MAVLTASKVNAWNHTRLGNGIPDYDGKVRWVCEMSAHFDGWTYVAADGARVAAVSTAIANSIRSGVTLDVTSIQFGALGWETWALGGGEVVANQGGIGAKSLVYSSDTLSMKLTYNDLSTDIELRHFYGTSTPLVFVVLYRI